jgi:hypothetical protein
LALGGYDASPNTEALAVDVYAHAKLLAQADLDGKRLLSVLEGFPPDLISEYETEYGLPLKCTVNASRTFEERLQILNWVRTSRNVLNWAYLEQLLAIFGVILIDIMKFKPLLCTAPCNAPVNTERLRYKVFLRLQYPVNADMGCIIENYLPGYLRIDWTIDMPWGVWILNAGVTVNTSGIAHYTAYKTNQLEYYDSFANFNLTDAIIRSFHDTDMQQWQGFKDAVNELTGVTDWILDLANNQIKYNSQDQPLPTYKYIWLWNGTQPDKTNSQWFGSTPEQACRAIAPVYQTTLSHVSNITMTTPTSGTAQCNWTDGFYQYVRLHPNPLYDPTAEKQQKSISLDVVAQQVISNASSSNQAISLLAEAYLENVAKSIFAADESKQFVTIADLIDKFELNKFLRV